ncbi:mas-related G-protein coupled receptor member X1-like [Lacerta agilis]|uniref:mas-related G-protein coupled receptor member X1-like n=1 Tax=Lacerta agilis TaxID=80427 RepID=UPI001419BC25|nr:mas-related G-protein coupled receptor member X1-like [Lacerta agilis]
MANTTQAHLLIRSIQTQTRDIGYKCFGSNLTDDIIYCLSLFICIFGLLGNGIVIWFLQLDTRKNPLLLYILSLAVADLFFLFLRLFITYFFFAQYFVTHIFPWCEPMPILSKMDMSPFSSGMYFLTAISVERCLCALCPFWYRCFRPAWLSSTVAAVLWSADILLFGLDIYSLSNGTVCDKMQQNISLVNLAFFTPIMILSSLTLFIKVRFCSLQRPTGRLCKTILLTVLVFVVFSVPLNVHHIASDYELSSVFYMLACINSSINPAIYFRVGFCRERWFREPLQFIIQRSLTEENEAEEERNVCCSTDRDIANSQVEAPNASVASVKPVGITGPVMTSSGDCGISVLSSQL